MKRFYDFLFKVFYSYGLRYDNQLIKSPSSKLHFKVYIGKGNNS